MKRKQKASRILIIAPRRGGPNARAKWGLPASELRAGQRPGHNDEWVQGTTSACRHSASNAVVLENSQHDEDISVVVKNWRWLRSYITMNIILDVIG